MHNDPTAVPSVKDGIPMTGPGAPERVIIRIRPPESSPMLHELFVLEVVVRRDWFEAWRDKNPNAEPGKSPHVKFNGDDLRMVHVPCRLSSYVVLGERLRVDHYAMPLDLMVNCSLKLDTLSACFISGTIVSGSIRVLNPEVALKWSEPFFHKLWPTETASVCALYLSRSQFQMEVIQDEIGTVSKNAGEGTGQTNATPRKEALRLSYVGDVRKPDGTSRGRMWKLVYCPQETCSGGAKPVDPALRVQTYRDRVQAIAKELKSIEVLNSPESAAIYYFVDGTVIREILKPGITFAFPSAEGGRSTRWRPGTLIVRRDVSDATSAPGSESYAFVDYDEVNLILTTGKPADSKVAPDVSLTMESGIGIEPQWRVIQIPDLCLAGTQDKRNAEQDYMWCVANLTPQDSSVPSYQGLPASWVRIRIGKPALSPSTVENGELHRLHDLSGPLIIAHKDWPEEPATASAQPQDWTLAIEIPEERAQQPRDTVVPRFSLTLSTDTSGGVTKHRALIELSDPEIKATSALMALYDQSPPDPQSAPNEKQFETKLRPHRLVFRNASRFAAGRDQQGEGLLKAILSPNKVDFECGQDVVVGYVPASRALVDPVSATAGNLTPYRIMEDISFGSGTIKGPSAPSNVIRLESGLSFKPEGLWIELAHGNEADVFLIKGWDDEGRTITLDREWKAVPNETYNYTIRQTRLALPRDPNHGLIPLHFRNFQLRILPWLVTAPKLPELHFDVSTMRGSEVSSVMALLPWAEWGPTPKAWLKSGRIRLHHRNLLMEHAEFESSFEDRFPASGHAATPEETQEVNNTKVSPLLPFEDFVNAVRDRYTEASGNLLLRSNEAACNLRNWFPGAELLASDGTTAVSRLLYEEDANNPLPAVKLAWQTLSGKPPKEQVLQVRRPGAGDSNWLEFDCETKELTTDKAPKLVIKDADPPADPKKGIPHGDYRVVNSSGPLMFDAAAVTAIAYCELPKESGDTKEKYAVLLGAHDGNARLWASWDPTTFVSVGDGNPERITSADLFYRDGRLFALIVHADGSTQIWSALLWDSTNPPLSPEKKWDSATAIPATEQITAARFARYSGNVGVIVGVRTKNGGKPGKAYVLKEWDWDAGQPGETAKIEWRTTGVTDAVSAVAVAVATGNGHEYVLLCGEGGQAEVQDIAAAPPTTWDLKPTNAAHVTAADLACGTDGNFVAVIVRTDGTAELWKQNARQSELLHHPSAVSSARLVAFSNLDELSTEDNPHFSPPQYCITGCRDGMVRL
jgi:hypothetical protein